jgi:hypothetical protein
MIGSAVNADRLDIYAPKYPNTRDDSGATTPINFLYTDASGNFLSAPTSALGGGAGWSLTGNAGTTVGTNFIGTTDAQDLMFKVDNTPSGRINIDKENTSLGYGSNNSGFGNTAVGFNALSINTNGSNVAVGSRVLEASTNAKFNVGLGYNALKLSTGGSGNIAVGAYAGDAITTGSENIIIGGSQDTPTATTDQFLNIGGAIFGTGLTGNQLAPAGNIGIGKVAPAEKLDVAGSFHNQTQLASGRYTGFYSGLNTIGGGYQSSSIYNMPNPTIGAGELLNYVSVQDGASIIGSTQDVTSATGESATGTFLAGDIYLETKDNNSNSFAVLRVQTPNQGKNLWNSVQDPSGINNSTTIDFDAASPIAFKFSTLGVYSEYRFPRTDGAANQFLQTDGSGNLSWGSASSLGLDNTNDAFVNNSTSTRVELGTTSAGAARTAGSEFVVNDNGRVGVGTTDPKTLLHLSSGADVQLGAEPYGVLTIGTATGTKMLLDNNEIHAYNGTNTAGVALSLNGAAQDGAASTTTFSGGNVVMSYNHVKALNTLEVSATIDRVTANADLRINGDATINNGNAAVGKFLRSTDAAGLSQWAYLAIEGSIGTSAAIAITPANTWVRIPGSQIVLTEGDWMVYTRNFPGFGITTDYLRFGLSTNATTYAAHPTAGTVLTTNSAAGQTWDAAGYFRKITVAAGATVTLYEFARTDAGTCTLAKTVNEGRLFATRLK